MITMQDLASGATLAEEQGMTEDLGRAVAKLASHEIAAGRVETARQILEGLAVTNPYDPAAWAMLALVERRRGRTLSARLCAETAHHLAPDDAQVRLVRAEVMLLSADERPRATAELAALRSGQGEVAARAGALLTALGA
jgi:cytochrome c-type biogenesis protein CcmH/NrfG